MQSNFGGYLTPAELKEIGEQLLAMWLPYMERIDADFQPIAPWAHGWSTWPPSASRAPTA